MRTSNFPLQTLKEVPADAEIASHRLMLRAGLIRKLAAGLYTWLPLGLRVLRKVETIVREEMDRAGALEVLMPAVQPAELWQESGRWDKYGAELLRMTDRHQREFCFGPTHEEIITDLARNELRSYRQLPINYYQIQTKFRDEIRPRFGVMRAREFLMKDAYSFHVDQASLQQTYDLMHATYCRIFDRCGLDFRPVAADTGSIGGSGSHEFHVLADSGEDAIAFSTDSDYAANVELAEATGAGRASRAAPTREMTPGRHARCQDHRRTGRTVRATDRADGQDPDRAGGRGCRRRAGRPADARRPRTERDQGGETAAGRRAAARWPARSRSVPRSAPVPARSVRSNLKLPMIVDRAAAVVSDFSAGANSRWPALLRHQLGPRRRRCREVADIRNVVEGDPSPDGKGSLTIARGIEVGHIFQLGRKYSEALNATVLDENGKAGHHDHGLLRYRRVTRGRRRHRAAQRRAGHRLAERRSRRSRWR